MTPDEKRAQTRQRFAAFVPVMDELGADAKMKCITDHAGNVLAGKKREPDDLCWISAEFIGMAIGLQNAGSKRK